MLDEAQSYPDLSGSEEKGNKHILLIILDILGKEYLKKDADFRAINNELQNLKEVKKSYEELYNYDLEKDLVIICLFVYSLNSYCENICFPIFRTFRRNVQTYLGTKISDKDVGLLGLFDSFRLMYCFIAYFLLFYYLLYSGKIIFKHFILGKLYSIRLDVFSSLTIFLKSIFSGFCIFLCLGDWRRGRAELSNYSIKSLIIGPYSKARKNTMNKYEMMYFFN
uniref:Unclassified n=1 Tax=Heterorhabditis bacteriophora TaxID=37862 RepID=A0A1I7WRB3_HETBA